MVVHFQNPMMFSRLVRPLKPKINMEIVEYYLSYCLEDPNEFDTELTPI